MDDCIFCKIIKGEIPSYKIYEDDDYFAFLDRSQFTEGHTLVIPKNHSASVWDVPNIGDYFEVIQKLGNHIKSQGYKFVDVMIFGRDVPHCHVHLLPHNGDQKDYEHVLEGLASMQGDEKRWPTPEKGAQIVAKLKL